MKVFRLSIAVKTAILVTSELPGFLQPRCRAVQLLHEVEGCSHPLPESVASHLIRALSSLIDGQT
ncbi:uncharacterized protein BKA55DRAFT_568665 [Fusarium redolens]|uniref:Uncharacterized protein n=1 Tax=Fusarium redolens TaxID=48865 RepID=A0A9P9H2N6_FUSRE|nr:uncharacterized protein BKA55DRAFT_568665 [Fusarium redolens]KAH7250060.1 hypothetical protein BKA55DRAFT_568665 [Fusarium redolens]